MSFLLGTGFRNRTLAIGLVAGVLAAMPSVNAASRLPSEEKPVTQAGDDREDDVTAFFQSGAYKQRLVFLLNAVGLLGAAAAAAGLAVKRSAPSRRPIR